MLFIVEDRWEEHIVFVNLEKQYHKQVTRGEKDGEFGGLIE